MNSIESEWYINLISTSTSGFPTFLYCLARIALIACCSFFIAHKHHRTVPYSAVLIFGYT